MNKLFVWNNACLPILWLVRKQAWNYGTIENRIVRFSKLSSIPAFHLSIFETEKILFHLQFIETK